MNHFRSILFSLLLGLAVIGPPRTAAEVPDFPASFTDPDNVAARGRVVDARGLPVAGVTVTCPEIYLAGYNSAKPAETLADVTDSDGIFELPLRFDVVPQKRAGTTPPFPRGSRYVLEARPSTGGFAFVTPAFVPNTEPATITLLPALTPHRFVIETDPGVWTDATRLAPEDGLKFLSATTSFTKVWIPVPTDVLERGGPFPAGSYLSLIHI